jgi:hypothetical protein
MDAITICEEFCLKSSCLDDVLWSGAFCWKDRIAFLASMPGATLEIVCVINITGFYWKPVLNRFDIFIRMLKPQPVLPRFFN